MYPDNFFERIWDKMFYRTDKLEENKINPVTGQEYDSSWIILMLTNSKEYSQMCGSSNGCAYTIKIAVPSTKTGKWQLGILLVLTSIMVKTFY